jgi:pimeloyl-ACP methyl ester carboxylesterase
MKPPDATATTRRQVLSMGLGLAAGGSLSPLAAAAAPAKTSTFVLVHGAWHGGWCWRRVVDRLAAQGHYVVAPTLSGVGERSHLSPDSINLTTQINDVVGEIKWKDLDRFVLVGHSYGGMVITGVAEQLRDRIAAVVYLDAFMPADGQSLYDLTKPSSIPQHVTAPHPASAFHVNEKDAAWVDSKLTPHPVQCFSEKLKVTGAYQTIPRKLYIRAPLFQTAAFDHALDACRADHTWATETVTCGHDVMIDQPEKLTAMLQNLV